MTEELDEISREMTENPNMPKLTKELCDLIYVVAGTIIEFGLQDKIEEAFDLVHRSNMSKLRTDGTPIIREDGKILKSENYFEPDLTPLFQ